MAGCCSRTAVINQVIDTDYNIVIVFLLSNPVEQPLLCDRSAADHYLCHQHASEREKYRLFMAVAHLLAYQDGHQQNRSRRTLI